MNLPSSNSNPSSYTSSLLTTHKITAFPASIYYIPAFISPAEEATLLQQVASQPQSKWTILSHRRLQTHPTALTASNVLLSAADLPMWLHDPIVPRMKELGGVWVQTPHKGPNHVLINEYRPGEGIMPHEDGSAYAPVVATVSLGAPIVLDIYEKGTRRPKWRILQEPRSLLITTETMYTEYLHGIITTTADEHLNENTIANWEFLGDKESFNEGRYDRATRTSLTYRDVCKVSSIGKKLFGGRK